MTQHGFLVICSNPVLQRTLRFSELRPGAVNRTRESRIDASGKGINVARVLTQLGARATQLTPAGGQFRELFLALAAADGLTVEWVESRSEIRWCTTLLDRHTLATTELVEEAAPVDAATEGQLRAAFERLLSAHHTVTLSGTKAPGFSPTLYPELVAMARGADRRVIVDVAGSDLIGCLEAHPDVAKPNYEEFVATYFPDRSADLEGASTEALVRERMSACSRNSGAAIVVTRGARPTLAAEGQLWEEPAEFVQPLNTTGSGDAFTAGLAHALAQGRTLREAVDVGHRAGAANARMLRPGVIV